MTSHSSRPSRGSRPRTWDSCYFRIPDYPCSRHDHHWDLRPQVRHSHPRLPRRDFPGCNISYRHSYDLDISDLMMKIKYFSNISSIHAGDLLEALVEHQEQRLAPLAQGHSRVCHSSRPSRGSRNQTFYSCCSHTSGLPYTPGARRECHRLEVHHSRPHPGHRAARECSNAGHCSYGHCISDLGKLSIKRTDWLTDIIPAGGSCKSGDWDATKLRSREIKKIFMLELLCLLWFLASNWSSLGLVRCYQVCRWAVALGPTSTSTNQQPRRPQPSQTSQLRFTGLREDYCEVSRFKTKKIICWISTINLCCCHNIIHYNIIMLSKKY